MKKAIILSLIMLFCGNLTIVMGREVKEGGGGGTLLLYYHRTLRVNCLQNFRTMVKGGGSKVLSCLIENLSIIIPL